MITVELMGGLGNQLFQIFTLMAYCFDNKSKIIFENKDINIGERKIQYWDNLLSNLQIFLKPPINHKVTVREQKFHYTALPMLKNNDTDAKLIGYFQSYKYFQHHIDTIMKFIKLTDKKAPLADNYCYEFSISLHFRVGDYKKLQDYHPLLPVNYYIKALQHIERVTGRTNWQVIYFCEDEDIEYVNGMVAQIQEAMPVLSFIKIESTYNDWQQMLVMSLCKHNIIANSSFSWWGAYLNTQENIVCYPNKWFGPKLKNNNTKDLCPPNWTKIDC
jgi:hypothetical protein